MSEAGERGPEFDEAVEMLKAGRAPASVRGALIARGMSDGEAGTLVSELQRLKADQDLAELDERLRRDQAPPSLATYERRRAKRGGVLMILTGLIILAAALRRVFMNGTEIYFRPHRISEGTVILSVIGLILILAGILRKLGKV
jgi:hypothetical protein